VRLFHDSSSDLLGLFQEGACQIGKALLAEEVHYWLSTVI